MHLLVGLGLRAAIGRGGRGRGAILAAGAAVGVLACMTALGAALVVRRETARSLEPRLEAPSATPWVVGSGGPHVYRGHEIEVVEVAAGPGAPRLRGGVPLPSAGEALLTPALADLAARDPTLRRWFPASLRVLPHAAVGPAGQLRAFVGADPARLPRAEPSGPGSDAGAPIDWWYARYRRGGRYPVLGFVAFCVLPGAVFAAVCARVGARGQRRRTVALRLAGVSRRGAAVVAATEALPWAVLGGLAGWGAFAAASRAVVTLPLVGRRYFPADADPGPFGAAAVVAGVALLLAGLGAGAASSAARLGRTSRPALAHRPVSRWALAPAALAAALTAAGFVRRLPNDPVLTAAVVAWAVALPPAILALTPRVAARLAGRAPVSVLVGLRRIEHDPGRAVRVAGVAALGVYAVAVAQVQTHALRVDGGDWVDEAVRSHPAGIVGRLVAGGHEPLRLTRPAPAGLRAMLPTVDVAAAASGSARTPQVLIATCGQLRSMEAGDLGRAHVARPCGDEPPRDHDALGGLVPGLSVLDSFPVRYRLDPDRARAAGLADNAQRGGWVESAPTLEAWEEVQAWVVGSQPGYRLDSPWQLSVRPGRVGLWVLLGVAVTSVLVALSGVALAAATAVARAGELTALRAVGVPRTVLRRSQLAEGVLAGVVAVGLALAGALSVTAAYQHMQRDEPFPSLVPAAAAAVAALVACVAMAWLPSLLVGRSPGGRRRTTPGSTPAS